MSLFHVTETKPGPIQIGEQDSVIQILAIRLC